MKADRIRKKYERTYYMPPSATNDWVQKEYIEKAPIWCSVDLRDGNQALVEPMGLEEKLEFFRMLVQIGFKEIEVGFPAASDTEYNFVRALIERGMIPPDVTIQVLTQAREHIIRRTFEAVKGAPHAVIHLYNSTSRFQREQVFCKSREEIKKLAVDGAVLVAAANQAALRENAAEGREERIVDILNYIQQHYRDVTLAGLAESFHLSAPYLSKYIREKSGSTFQENVKQVRLGRAKILLRESAKNIEAISEDVGYENVEHFNRLFKKAFGMTPVQYRQSGCP